MRCAKGYVVLAKAPSDEDRDLLRDVSRYQGLILLLDSVGEPAKDAEGVSFGFTVGEGRWFEDSPRMKCLAEQGVDASAAFAAECEQVLSQLFGAPAKVEPVVASLADAESLRIVRTMGETIREQEMPGIFGGLIAGNKDDDESEGMGLAPAAEPASLEQALAALDGLVGMADIKRQVAEIATCIQRNGRDSVSSLHMVLTGNPGTGKTVLARAIADVYAALGIVRPGKFIETDRAGLVGKFLGDTEVKVTQLIERARGGVLFIDEAYALANCDDSGKSRDGHTEFGTVALNLLVKALEDHRDDLVVIMAGYPELMNKMLDVNPGLRDRIGFYLEFPDYNAAELRDIFASMMAGRDFQSDGLAMEEAGRYFELIAKHKDKNFSNARLVRKVTDRVVMKHVLRAGDKVIEVQDVHAAFAEKDLCKLLEPAGPRRRSIGFIQALDDAA